MLNSFRNSNGLPNKLDIVIEENASFDMTLTITQDDEITPIDLTGWGITGSIRHTFGDTVVTNFTSSISLAEEGVITEFLSGPQTWLLNNSTYKYDIIANDPTNFPTKTYRLVYGDIQIVRGVTQP